MRYIIILSFFLFIGAGCTQVDTQLHEPQKDISVREIAKEKTEPLIELPSITRRVEFGLSDGLFRFSAEIPDTWEVEYVPSIKSYNIYDPQDESEDIRNKSQIFIRRFEANDFLTLDTVTILSSDKTEIHGRDAVHYHIKKKDGVADFRDQPDWRNAEHRLIDIRYTENNPSPFYVFAYDPSLDVKIFDAFIDSLVFDNDPESFVAPMDDFKNRTTKKPFGIEIDPATSPVQPERFSGFHTAVDFEVTGQEFEHDVPFVAACGGKILDKRRVNGYGGLLVQECLLEDQRLGVIYGHVDLESILQTEGQYIAPGEYLGNLGAHESRQTDGERKHLHFGMYKTNGFDLDIRGYVPTSDQLEAWIDPVPLLK